MDRRWPFSGSLLGSRLVAVSLGLVVAFTPLFASPWAQAARAVWIGERMISSPSIGDGWEPAVAADRFSPYVYAAWMQFPKPYIAVIVSPDGGSTWRAPQPLCTNCANQGQYDVTLAVTSTGAVYAVFMKQYDIVFATSSDHGATWSAPTTISAGTWADKPWLGAGANGRDVYVTWTTRGNLYAVDSHDAGSTWTRPLQVTSDKQVYYYSNGSAVLANDTAVVVASEYPENGNNTKVTGPVPIVAFRTTNGGASWSRTVVDTLYTGATFATSSVATVAADARGTLVLAYSGSLSVGANGHVYVRRSTDSAATWSARTELTTSAGGADATSVAAAGGASGTFRVTWMDARTGGWNVWERDSTNGGQTWGADQLVSDATTGAAYKTASGFGFPYGDYDTVAINSAGKSVAVMGEGDGTRTHGDIWENVQT